MSVHIITAKGWRQSRFSHPHQLRDVLGWTVGKHPNPDADVNYLLGYSSGWRMYDAGLPRGAPLGGWHETPLAIFFSHVESHGLLRRVWRECAEVADLRLLTTRQTLAELEAYGPTELITHTMDRDFYCLSERIPNRQRPRIGLNGVVNVGGRKGELLLKQLTGSPLAKRARFLGAGRGWPEIECHYFKRKEMIPRFFHKLELLLCTSLIDGGPSGPLEALTCGVPVVIPMGVGVMDELPDTHGIYRYPRGDYDGMYEALLNCIAALGTHDRVALRQATEPMSVERYCGDTAAAFAKHFGEERTMQRIPEEAAS